MCVCACQWVRVLDFFSSSLLSHVTCVLLECVFAPLPARTLSTVLVLGRCCCQHTLQLLGYQWGRYNVDSFLEFIAFFTYADQQTPCLNTPRQPTPPTSCSSSSSSSYIFNPVTKGVEGTGFESMMH